MITELAPDAPADLMIEVDDVRKSFGPTRALRGVSCTFHRGEFVALLGSNGAGKSTLIKILDRVYTADSGRIGVRGGRHGLGVVHQDLGLVDDMTVAQNIFLGEPRRWVNPARDARRAVSALATVGLERIDPHALVSSLTLGERAMVAVARTLDRGAETVVVDEVTAGLHPREARWVVEQLQVAVERGATVLMVTHKLGEVLGIASRYVLLSDGEVALDGPAADVGRDDLVALMSRGRTTPTDQELRERGAAGEVLCTLSSLCAGAAGPVDLQVRRGEIVALTGPLGSGVHEVAYAAAGLLRPRAGTVVTTPGVQRACLPAHRESEGMFAEATVGFNVTAGTWTKWHHPTRLLRMRRMRDDSDQAIERLGVVPHRLEATVSELSGGNQQKTLLARALIRSPQLLILCEPTRGVDVATRREIYAQVRRVAQEGAAVLVASTDREDIEALADRVGVIGPDGQVTSWLDAEDMAELTSVMA